MKKMISNFLKTIKLYMGLLFMMVMASQIIYQFYDRETQKKAETVMITIILVIVIVVIIIFFGPRVY